MWSVSVRRCSVSGRMFAAGIYKQDVHYMYMSYVEAHIWNRWVWPVGVKVWPVGVKVWPVSVS